MEQLVDTTYTDRTFVVGGFAVRIRLQGQTWLASTAVPYRDGEAPTHPAIGGAPSALGAVLALSDIVRSKAEVVLHLTPSSTVYTGLAGLASGLQSLAWGTVAGHTGHPAFEEVTPTDGA